MSYFNLLGSHIAHPAILQYYLLAYNCFVLDRGAAVNVCCARDCEAICVEHCAL